MFAFQRGLATGIYTTNSPEACQYVAANCEANIVVVENQAQLSKILQVRKLRLSACPSVAAAEGDADSRLVHCVSPDTR